ncbi:MAG: response regulator transcription factor [Actinobacteria bacterium]|nr:response regulator transcription factor [Actinomycetota bacterium]
MKRLLLVDEAVGFSELFAVALRDGLDAAVDVVAGPDAAGAVAAAARPHVAVVDDRFPAFDCSCIDALVAIRERSPETKLVVLSRGDAAIVPAVRDAWELLPVVAVLSRTRTVEDLVDALRTVTEGGEGIVDAPFRAVLPEGRPSWRSVERFRLLVQHLGHAKLWSALLDPSVDIAYQAVAAQCGLAVNTIKNYRAQLLPELSVHGLDDPSLREMQAFAHRCRVLLRPWVDARLDQSGEPAAST